MVLHFLKAWFGDFSSKEELKKFVMLGGIFSLVIGIYWTLRPIKDTIFSTMVHSSTDNLAEFIPWAKIVSLIVLFPLVIIYSKLVERYPRQHMFYALGSIYFVLTIAFGLLFMHPTLGLANTVGSPYRILGWAWYVFVESYGSLMVALFWAFATDITTPESAKRGFALTVLLGQLGSMVGPGFITPLGKQFGSSAPVVLICAGLLLFVILGVRYFMMVTPADQLVGFHGKNEKEVEKHQEPGFLEGLKLMLSEPYLLGIFAIIAIYEILGTVIDYNFKAAVFKQFTTEVDRSAYLGDYGFYVNLISFFCLLFGINNIQRYLGVTVSLALMPFIIGGMIALFLLYGDVRVLFWIMVSTKAINYALNGPVIKQLYVPTTQDVKYKSQAWIETFGSRSSKAAGSGINIAKKGLGQYFILAMSLITLGLCGVWFFVAIYLGRSHKKAVDNNKVVC